MTERKFLRLLDKRSIDLERFKTWRRWAELIERFLLAHLTSNQYKLSSKFSRFIIPQDLSNMIFFSRKIFHICLLSTDDEFSLAGMNSETIHLEVILWWVICSLSYSTSRSTDSGSDLALGKRNAQCQEILACAESYLILDIAFVASLIKFTLKFRHRQYLSPIFHLFSIFFRVTFLQ